MTNIHELAKRAHETARSKGFWDGNVDFNTNIMLIISELSEALEAVRKNKIADNNLYNERISVIKNTLNYTRSKEEIDAYFSDYQNYMFKLVIKDTFEDEIADTILRILDTMQGFDIEINLDFPNKDGVLRSLMRIETIGEQMLYITTVLTDVYRAKITGYDEGVATSLNISLYLLLVLSESKGIDIELHINEKLRYNSTREYLHGKKF